MNDHYVLDHFAGAGGWDAAARELGAAVTGVENMPAALATRALNNLPVLHSNVWNMDETSVDADTFVSSPPCQAYSTAGKGAGRKALDEVVSVMNSDLVLHPQALREEALRWGDERIGLVLTPMTYVLRNRPRYVALEQVPNVLPVWQAMGARLIHSGYEVWVGTLNAEQYGVPQTRRRAVLIARLGPGPRGRERFIDQPRPTHSKYHVRTPARMDEGVLPWVSMGQALSRDDDVHLRSNYGTGGDPAARGERELHQPAPTVTSKVSRNKWVFNDQSGTEYDPEWPDKRPSTTVAGRGLVQNPGATANRFNGSTKSRNDGVKVTVAEAAALQSFPPDFQWGGTESSQYLQVGNAVPPLLARAILKEVWR